MRFPIKNRTPKRLAIVLATLATGASVASADLNSFAIDLIEMKASPVVFTLSNAKTYLQTPVINSGQAGGSLHAIFNRGAISDSLFPSIVPDSGTYLSLGEDGNGQVQASNTSAMTFTKGSQMINAPLPSGALAGLGLLGSLVVLRTVRRR